MSDQPPVNARFGPRLTLFLFAWLALLVLFVASQFAPPPPEPERAPPPPAKAEPPRGYDPVRDVHDSVAAAKEVDSRLTRTTPGADKIIAFVDVSNRDGHLVVHFKEVYNRLSSEDKAPLEALIVELWKKTKYVARRDWSPAVEFVEHEGTATRSHTIRPGSPDD